MRGGAEAATQRPETLNGRFDNYQAETLKRWIPSADSNGAMQLARRDFFLKGVSNRVPYTQSLSPVY